MEKRLIKKDDSSGQDASLDAAVIESRFRQVVNPQSPRLTLPELPESCTVLAVTPSGRSLWVGTVRIEVRLENGSVAAFFKKVRCIPFPGPLETWTTDLRAGRLRRYRQAHDARNI